MISVRQFVLGAAVAAAAVGLASAGAGQVHAAPVLGEAVITEAPGGTLSAVLTAGNSDTPFSLRLPSGAACSGDTATGGFLVSTYMVPSTVDPSTLTFDAGGPVPQGFGSTFRQPLYSAGGQSPQVQMNTALNTGLVLSILPMALDLYGPDGPSLLPAGTYNVGVACVGTSGVDHYWNAQMIVVADPADTAAGLRWTTEADPPPTSSTDPPDTTETSVDPPASSTPQSSTPQSSTPDSSTPTSATNPSSSDPPSVSSSSVAAVAISTKTGSGGSTLPGTGDNVRPLILLAVGLLVLGRFVVLLCRRVEVTPPRGRD